MKMKIIASGSKGNSSLFFTKKTSFLIDLGISYKRINEALKKENFLIESLDFVLITHEHIDHVGGIYTFIKKTKCKIYMSAGTFKGLLSKSGSKELLISSAYDEGRIVLLEHDVDYNYNALEIDDFTIKPIASSHDAYEPINYIIYNEDKKISFLTDTGYVNNKYVRYLENSNAYVLECNHDPEILLNSTRPFMLKQRILSDKGHLSNDDALYILTKLVGNKTKHVFYAHISEECNLREIIDQTRKNIFKSCGVSSDDIEFHFTGQVPLEVIEI